MTEPQDTTTEDELITLAKEAISEDAWIVGRCASLWTKKYARGRGDADFGSAVGLSEDQICDRRRVWETFADVKSLYSKLYWSHFKTALTWEDSEECLAWAEEMGGSVAEMKCWRRIQHGEDISEVMKSVGDNQEVPERSGTSEPVEPVRRDHESSKVTSAAATVSQSHIAPGTTEPPRRGPGPAVINRETYQAEEATESQGEDYKLVRGLATQFKRLAKAHPHLKYAIADQLVRISDQIRADEDITGMDAPTLKGLLR